MAALILLWTPTAGPQQPDVGVITSLKKAFAFLSHHEHFCALQGEAMSRDNDGEVGYSCIVQVVSGEGRLSCPQRALCSQVGRCPPDIPSC